MPKFPRKPQTGDKVLQALYDSICQIIDYLPSLEVRGDNKTTSVNHTEYGTTIKAILPHNSIIQAKKGEGGEGEEYFADNTTLTLNPTTNVFSIKPPADSTKNYALVCLSGTIQWIELEDC